MSPPLIVVGAGGHAKVVIDALLRAGAEVLGLVDRDPTTHGGDVLGVAVIGDDSALENRPAGSFRLVNGVGGGDSTATRHQVFERLRAAGHEFAGVVHPSAVLAPDVRLAEGAQVMAGAVVQPGTSIGIDAIVNTGARIDHDCRIGDHAHVAPGAVLAGGVTLDAGVMVATGACIVDGVRLGAWAIAAAGAVVLGDVAPGVIVAGVPAKEMGR
jgi:UDP-perosamine 4-acetyltransferase